MICQAYIKEGRLYVNFNHESVVYDGFNFPLGDAVTNFSALPEAVYRLIFEKMKDVFLTLFVHKATYDETFETLKEIVVATSVANPYLNFYMDNFMMYLLCLIGHQQLIPDLMTGFLLNNGSDVDPRGVNFPNLTDSAPWGLEVFINDLKKRQSRLKEDFEAIISGAEDSKDLTHMQRLYLLSLQGRNYLSGKFKTTLSPDYQNMPADDLGKVKSTLLENKVDIVEMVGIEVLDDLIGFELYHTLKENLLLRKCKHCGEYFIVRGRIDIEYCDRIKAGETKPCSIIGATRSYWGSKVDDPIHVAFQKAYKRNHSRQRVGKMTNQEFYDWSEEARVKRGECEAGRLPLDDFIAWLGNKR